MLNQQPHSETAGEDVTGVTSAEMASAITAIEKRKAEEAQRLSGAAQVRQVVQELGIDATPEEVLEEVRRQRLAREEEARRRAAPAPQPQQTYSMPVVRIRTGRHSWWRWVAIIGFGSFIVNHFSNGTVSSPWTDSDPVTQLSRVHDGDTVKVDTPTLIKLIGGAPPASIQVNEPGDNHMWKIIKHDGQPYLEGYLARKTSPQEASAGPLNIYDDDDPAGDNAKSVTLPLDGVHLLSSKDIDDDTELTLDNVKLDSYAYDDDDN